MTARIVFAYAVLFAAATWLSFMAWLALFPAHEQPSWSFQTAEVNA